jgi:hypothetical protein
MCCTAIFGRKKKKPPTISVRWDVQHDVALISKYSRTFFSEKFDSSFTHVCSAMLKKYPFNIGEIGSCDAVINSKYTQNDLYS